jgi:hypothetical protein
LHPDHCRLVRGGLGMSDPPYSEYCEFCGRYVDYFPRRTWPESRPTCTTCREATKHLPHGAHAEARDDPNSNRAEVFIVWGKVYPIPRDEMGRLLWASVVNSLVEFVVVDLTSNGPPDCRSLPHRTMSIDQCLWSSTLRSATLPTINKIRSWGETAKEGDCLDLGTALIFRVRTETFMECES